MTDPVSTAGEFLHVLDGVGLVDDLDAEQRRRYAQLVKKAQRIEPVEREPKRPTDRIIEDATTLVELGLPADGLAMRLGIRPATYSRWIREGAEKVDVGKRKAPTARLYLATEAAWQRVRLDFIVASRQRAFEQLERRDYPNFGRRPPTDPDAEADRWDLEPDEAFL